MSTLPFEIHVFFAVTLFNEKNYSDSRSISRRYSQIKVPFLQSSISIKVLFLRKITIYIFPEPSRNVKEKHVEDYKGTANVISIVFLRIAYPVYNHCLSNNEEDIVIFQI